MKRLSPLCVGVLLATAWLAGCDESFDPIAASNRQFSVFGHLDASADTQWIRIMPMRGTIFTSPEPPGVDVSLEEFGTGRMLDVRHALFEFSYPFDEALDVGPMSIHNYWTADPIVPGETYRFTVSSRDGETTSAVIPVPPDYSVAVAIRQGENPPFGWLFDEVRIEGAEHLAFVRVNALVRNRCKRGVQQLRFALSDDSGQSHTVPVNKIFAFPDEDWCNPQVAERRDLWIVGSGAPWPRGQGFSEEAFGAPSLPTNLDGGIGFLGGVVTHTVPYEDCEIVGPLPTPEFCVLTYDDAKARVEGTIRDSCGNRPLVDGLVRLEQIEPDSAGHRRVRTSPTGLLGAYRIAGLEAGAYDIRISHPHPQNIPPVDGSDFPEYLPYEATLDFAPGEQRTLDITLQRVGLCLPP